MDSTTAKIKESFTRRSTMLRRDFFREMAKHEDKKLRRVNDAAMAAEQPAKYAGKRC